MDEADVRAALRGWWLPRITTFGVPGLWEDDQDPPYDTAWHRTTIRAAGDAPMTLGRARWENRGTIMVQVYAPLAGGPGALERLAASISASWRTCRLERIVLGLPSTADQPQEGAFNRALITVGWRADLRPA